MSCTCWLGSIPWSSDFKSVMTTYCVCSWLLSVLYNLLNTLYLRIGLTLHDEKKMHYFIVATGNTFELFKTQGMMCILKV